MVNWTDPAVITSQYVSYVKLVHVLAGLYTWEVANSLQFDAYMVKRMIQDAENRTAPKLVVKAVYWICRYAPLGAFATFIVGSNITSEIDCVAWAKSLYAFAFSGYVAASALIAIRSIAIWKKSVYIISISTASLIACFGTWIYTLNRISAAWDPVGGTCDLLNSRVATVPSVTATVVCDLVLLLSLSIGLFRCRELEAVRYGIWRLLFHQTLIWLALAFLAEIPVRVILLLDLNPVMDGLLFPVEMVILALGATRMYRSLFGSMSRSSDIATPNSQNSHALTPIRFGARRTVDRYGSNIKFENSAKGSELGSAGLKRPKARESA